MGEAKYRKANDPNYGKPKKPSTVRGLILSTPIIIDGQSIRTDGGLCQQDLRFALTYWDRLALPDNNVVSMMPDPQTIGYLEACGVLSRPYVRYGGTISGSDAVYDAPMHALTMYEREDEGAWSIHEGVNSVRRVGVEQEEQRGTLIQLLSAVPVPGEKVPFQEILEFKAKRRDELLHFREHFEALSNRISSGLASEGELEQTLREIDNSCADLLKVTREWQYPVKLADTKAFLNFDLGKAVTSAGETYGACLKGFGLSQTVSVIAAIGAAVNSQIKLEPAPSFQGITRPRSPYKYAYLVQRDLR